MALLYPKPIASDTMLIALIRHNFYTVLSNKRAHYTGCCTTLKCYNGYLVFFQLISYSYLGEELRFEPYLNSKGYEVLYYLFSSAHV